ncbi:MAG: methionine--tRNA ligase [Sphingobacteriales bacterium]|nr:MAG: methionine--tRNA ligase [Sphingobacteriales bacterium]
MENVKRYTVTAALPYTNGPVHIGHLAGCYLPSDIYARYLRLAGEDVLYICGSDEHGVAITIKAAQEGLTPQQLVDKYHNIIKNSFADFGISFDVYGRTSSPVHHKTASDFFLNLYEKGVFTKKTSSQFYDPEAKQFLADRYISGTCPNCAYEKAYGDQCERCGKSLDPTDLINPKSTLTGNTPELRETSHWYLPLQNYEPWLKEWLLEKHNDWKTNVIGQCRSWLTQGLHERSITRDMDWGVKVPLPDAEGKVLYVWMDAPIGYISAAKEWAEATGNQWEPYWKSDDTKLVHFIGKDNIVFHCIIFPTMLKAHGDFILPDNVPANEFLNIEGDKISTSRNWAVWVHEYLQDFPGKQDVMRYVLTANAPETKDNDFSWKDFQAKNNNELAAILGNLVNRVSILTGKYYNGKIPARGVQTQAEASLGQEVQAYPDKIGNLVRDYKFREAQQELMNLARVGNKYLTDNEPWKLVKTDAERTATVMHHSLQLLANLAILSDPFLPHTSIKLREALGLHGKQWKDAGTLEILQEGFETGKIDILFDQIEDAAIDAQIEKLHANRVQVDTPVKISPFKADISFDDFSKMDLRIAHILEAEKIPKTQKLLKLTVDLGIEKRTIVSGIAEYFSPEEVIGRKVCIVANLAPRNIKGIQSQGMVLMLEDKDGKLMFLQPDGDAPAGMEAR